MIRSAIPFLNRPRPAEVRMARSDMETVFAFLQLAHGTLDGKKRVNSSEMPALRTVIESARYLVAEALNGAAVNSIPPSSEKTKWPT